VISISGTYSRKPKSCIKCISLLTGQGTGLGLSLAYDIVKAHSGEIKVKSKEGSGSEFVVVLNG
jgi:signal transduction histidine kinase